MNDGTRRRLSAVPWLVIGTVLAFAPATADGQLSSSEESRLLREAARAESAGDYAASVEILTSLLAERPASSGAIFALERVLRAQGRVSQVLDPIDAFLAVDPVSTGPRYLKLRILLEVDSLAELRSAAQSWIAQNPASPDSYREVARVYERAFGGEEALSVLRRGTEPRGWWSPCGRSRRCPAAPRASPGGPDGVGACPGRPGCPGARGLAADGANRWGASRVGTRGGSRADGGRCVRNPAGARRSKSRSRLACNRKR